MIRIEPYKIEVEDEVLADLRGRLGATRFDTGLGGGSWEMGADAEYIRELCGAWREFDWRAVETELNGLGNFRAEVDGTGIHFLHKRGEGANAVPLLLLHGWPDSYLRFVKLLPLLTGGGARNFDVVIPSLPGFGFSGRPAGKGASFGVGQVMHRLMTEGLGYERYAISGGDIGGRVGDWMAQDHSNALIGLHMTDVPFFRALAKPGEMSAAEAAYFEQVEDWRQREGAYAALQGTKPATLALGLLDSPSGLAAWIVEKLRSWSDCGGDVERRFTRQEILTHLTLYWVTKTIGSSFLPYFDTRSADAQAEMTRRSRLRVEVPTAFSLFAKDLVAPPREWAERFYDVRRWSRLERGGHFAAFEEPEMYAEELRGFLQPG